MDADNDAAGQPRLGALRQDPEDRGRDFAGLSSSHVKAAINV
jgi:hypothetical protein